jgi:hypothetical protein
MPARHHRRDWKHLFYIQDQLAKRTPAASRSRWQALRLRLLRANDERHLTFMPLVEIADDPVADALEIEVDLRLAHG